MGNDPFNRITDALGEFGNGTTFNPSGPSSPNKGYNTPPEGLQPGGDPVCNGSGYLWQDAYGNEVKCWRCVGTGVIPNLVPPRPRGTVPETDEGIDGVDSVTNTEATDQGQQLDEVQGPIDND